MLHNPTDSVPPTFFCEEIGDILLGLYMRSESSGSRTVIGSACLLLGPDLLLNPVDLGVKLGGSVGSWMSGELGIGLATRQRGHRQ
jgi:hypothetical protein